MQNKVNRSRDDYMINLKANEHGETSSTKLVELGPKNSSLKNTKAIYHGINGIGEVTLHYSQQEHYRVNSRAHRTLRVTYLPMLKLAKQQRYNRITFYKQKSW